MAIPDLGISLPSITSLIELYAEYGLIDTYIPKLSSKTRIGSSTHEIVARIMLGGHIDENEWNTLDRPTKNAVMASQRWKKDTKFRPKEVESMVYSLEWGIAGHPDIIGIIPPWWICVNDWKTGDIDNIRVKLQIPTYGFCYLEMHPRRRLDGFRAVHLDTQKGTYSELLMSVEEGQHYFNEFIRMKKEVGIL